MKISISIGSFSHTPPNEIIEYAKLAERLGVERIWSAEAWGTDAITPLAFIASHTERVKLGTGIMQISARVPSMIAMTALTLARFTNGRFALGLGVSGPQVVEGLHGADYKAPLTRLKETVEIVRMAFRGEKIEFTGDCHQIPRLGGEGKAIRLDHPPNPKIPIHLATLAPRALEYTGAAGEGWLGTSFSPNHAEAHFAHLRRGAESVGRSLSDLDLQAACTVAIGSNVEEMIAARRPAVAFQMGAMGSARTNFYNAAFQRAGFVDDALAIQSLWLRGKREAAAARVPEAMIAEFGAIGTPEMVLERFRLYKASGITSLGIRIDGDLARRSSVLEEVVDLFASV